MHIDEIFRVLLMCFAVNLSPPECPSCNAPRRGPYCAECGERFLQPHDLNLRHFLFHELPHDLWHVDGKLTRTLRALLVTPGLLPSEYLAGRRVGYLAPLRLYLAVFLLHLAIIATSLDTPGTLLDQAARIDPTGLTLRLAHARPTVQWSDPALRLQLGERSRWTAEIGTALVFLGVAGVLNLLFYRQRRRYLEHAVFALSVTTWYLLLVSVGDLMLTVTRSQKFDEYELKLAEWLTPALAVYSWMAIRHFYGVTRLYTTVATIASFASQALIALMLNIFALAVLIATA
jgi:hypothetical protein